MLFIVYEHYDDNQPIYTNNNNNCIDNDCFICFEIKTINEIKPINLINQCIYYKKCICNGSVHRECLDLWFKKNKSCPICRVIMAEKSNYNFIFCNFIPKKLFISIIIKNLLFVMLRAIFATSIIYFIFDIYFISIKRNKQNTYTV